jgi:plastocyanin
MREKIIYKFLLSCIFIFQAHVAVAVEDFLEVDLYIKDHKFNPDILELPAGRKIRITVHNQDSTIEEFESIDLKREKIVLGNSSIRVILAPLQPGEYKFFGEFHEETAQGKIIVKKEE